jgi:hypothetical protein
VKGRTGLFQGRMQLSLGRDGKLEPSPVSISEVNKDRDLSAKKQSTSRDSKGRRGSPEKRNPPVHRSRGFKWSRIERKSE